MECIEEGMVLSFIFNAAGKEFHDPGQAIQRRKDVF
jgi:hypothetical protein